MKLEKVCRRNIPAIEAGRLLVDDLMSDTWLLLLAARLDSRRADQVGRKIAGIECFHIELHEAEERAAKVREISAAAIDNCRNAFNHSATRTDNLKGLLNAATPGDNIFNDQKTVAGVDLKPPAQDQPVFLFLRKNVRKPEGARHFVSDDQSSKRGRDGALRAQGAYFFGKLSADLRRDPGVLQQQRALEKLPAVQARAEQEMTVEKRAGLPEKF